MIEFTGERVLPGQVNDDLWAEHMARYAFAARYAAGKKTLDLGCGAGYGARELAQTASHVTALDVSPEAIAYAKETFASPAVDFIAASATQVPGEGQDYGLITAFEVIEHIEDWRDLLKEARRLLAPGGLFLVSTPNKLYYTESRAEHGPNPFHVHEFEYAEFRAALEEYFPHVHLLLQNRVEAQAFYQPAASIQFEAYSEKIRGSADDANFFLAVCSGQPVPKLDSFLYLPAAANILREREQHIHLLEKELAQNKAWLDEAVSKHHRLQQLHEEQTLHLEKQNLWAQDLDQLLKSAQQRVAELQEELKTANRQGLEVAAAYESKVRELEDENRKTVEWGMATEARLTAELAVQTEKLVEAVQLLDRAEATVVERTQWAQNLDQRLAQIEGQLQMIRQSRWLKLGRTVGLGPKFEADGE